MIIPSRLWWKNMLAVAEHDAVAGIGERSAVVDVA
jgi:hypothetical protein